MVANARPMTPRDTYNKSEQVPSRRGAMHDKIVFEIACPRRAKVAKRIGPQRHTQKQAGEKQASGPGLACFSPARRESKSTRSDCACRAPYRIDLPERPCCDAQSGPIRPQPFPCRTETGALALLYRGTAPQGHPAAVGQARPSDSGRVIWLGWAGSAGLGGLEGAT